MPKTPEKTGNGRRSLTIAIVAVVVIAVSVAAGYLLTRGDEDEVVAPLPSVAPPSPVGPCDFEPPVTVPAKLVHDEPFPMRLDPERREYSAVMKTSCGEMRIDLLAEQAPVAVNNFIELSNEGWYEGLLFHRLSDSLDIIQAGDPLCGANELECGSGGPGYKLDDELTGKERYGPGVVAMANSGPDSSGSQFFIVTGPGSADLPPKYTIFGELADEASLAVAQQIQSLPVRAREDAPPGAEPETPEDTIWIRGVRIYDKKA